MKKTGKLLMAAVVALGALSGCTSAQGDDIKKVSVVQIVSHSSLDTIRDSFSDEMEQLGYTETQARSSWSITMPAMIHRRSTASCRQHPEMAAM